MALPFDQHGGDKQRQASIDWNALGRRREADDVNATGCTKIETAGQMQNKSRPDRMTAAAHDWTAAGSMAQSSISFVSTTLPRLRAPSWVTAVLAPSHWGGGQMQGKRARARRMGVDRENRAGWTGPLGQNATPGRFVSCQAGCEPLTANEAGAFAWLI